MADHDVIILGAPFNGIGISPAEENPAQALREAGVIEMLKSRGVSVKDIGDLDIPAFDGRRDKASQVLNLAALKETSLRLSDRLITLGTQKAAVLILGGDCGILIGIVGAFVRSGKNVGLIMLDGHTDFRDPASSPSGEAADIPLWVITGRGPTELSGLFGRTPMLDESKIAVLGYREPDLIEQSEIFRLDCDQIMEIGITDSVNAGLQPLMDQDLDLWLHLDVDVVDPVEMPAVHFPEPGGLSLADTANLAGRIMDTRKVIGLSVACYHNNTDRGGSAGKKLARLISEIMVR